MVGTVSEDTARWLGPLLTYVGIIGLIVVTFCIFMLMFVWPVKGF